jgi:hypothetical protein
MISSRTILTTRYAMPVARAGCRLMMELESREMTIRKLEAGMPRLL